MPSNPRQQGPTLRDEQKLRTRAKLLDSAKSLFGRLGYSAVRVDDIAAAVGCSRATFYLHFGGKPDILRAVAEQHTGPAVFGLFADLDRVLDIGSRPEFVAWVRRTLEVFADQRDLLCAWDEAVALDPGFGAIAGAGLRAVPDALPGYLARWPRDRRAEARLRVELFVAQLERVSTRSVPPSMAELTPERSAEVFADIWYPALAAPPPSG